MVAQFIVAGLGLAGPFRAPGGAAAARGAVSMSAAADPSAFTLAILGDLHVRHARPPPPARPASASGIRIC